MEEATILLENIFEDWTVDFEHLEPGRQFAFEERMQDGIIWIKLVRHFNMHVRPGREWWRAVSVPDGIRKACSADGVLQDHELIVRPVRREFEVEVTDDFLREHLS